MDRDPPIRIESLPTAALFGPLVKVKLIEGGQSLSDRRDEHVSLTIRGKFCNVASQIEKPRGVGTFRDLELSFAKIRGKSVR